mgnify:CR=1 FL=1
MRTSSTSVPGWASRALAAGTLMVSGGVVAEAVAAAETGAFVVVVAAGDRVTVNV